jgi:hypothetical protein
MGMAQAFSRKSATISVWLFTSASAAEPEEA